MAVIKITSTNPSVRGEVKVTAVEPHIRIVITSVITGYTIQSLKGLEYLFSDPAVIVPTYRVDVLNYDEENKSGQFEFSFNVTRDAWYCIGEQDKKQLILNRAFVPANWTQNLYGGEWVPNYPKLTGLGAFRLTRFGQRAIPAKPLPRQTNLDKTPIEATRKDETLATDIMIHVGGTYEMKCYDHLGGSFGCFAFIPQEDIYSTEALAKQACIDDHYDDSSSNSEWKKISNKILKLSFEKKKKIKILLEYRDETQNYIPSEVLAE
ncbi:MAG: hypothetical protein PUK66_03740 [Bacteroidales bacterium]|uniref:hypothetical protein n=1 Tax=Porphyromonas sp. TaxID=1924944 RepID=UPI002970597C|nr:hypothetical protein [Porphyromonas sp.]MDD7437935.1 hypothetical protein [Bacteroidales bacterium]MDY3067185.1 hypothetical protein [Porphyromonas sp.]